MNKVWVYTGKCAKVFANTEAAREWFDKNDPEGVAFEHTVEGSPSAKNVTENINRAYVDQLAESERLREALQEVCRMNMSGGYTKNQMSFAAHKALTYLPSLSANREVTPKVKPVDENALSEALAKTRAEGVQHGELTMRERAAKVANDAAPVVSGEEVGEGFQTAIDIRNAICKLPLSTLANDNQKESAAA